jgi:cell division protein FtsN
MADRYQDRRFPAGNDYDRDEGSSAKAESDPLAELARLIGQTDPFGTRPMGRANLPVQPQTRPADPAPSYDNDVPPLEFDEEPAPAPPSWMQRAARQETPAPAPPPPLPEDDYPSSVHPLHRYAATHPPAEPDYDPAHIFAESNHEPDLSRYDEALYGGLDSGAQNTQHDQAYADDGYYDEDHHLDTAQEPQRRGGMITVFAVLALAVFGVGGAFAYRTFTGAGRSGEPPIIRADAGPTKIVPAPADGGTKVPDRMTAGDGTEKIVSREEAPIDPNARSGPRVVFPPLTPNGSAPLPSTVVPGAPPPTTSAANGTFSNNEPHRIKTFSVRGDQPDTGAPAAAAPPPTTPAKPAARAAATAGRPSATANPNAANANGPLSLAPQSEAPAAPEPAVRVATTTPVQIAPASGGGGGSYLVQVSSQRSEADAQASYRALQSKYPSVLGSQSVVVKRVDLGDKGVYYRAFAGPFTSADQATQMCSNLKAAGGPQCLIQRN